MPSYEESRLERIKHTSNARTSSALRRRERISAVGARAIGASVSRLFTPDQRFKQRQTSARGPASPSATEIRAFTLGGWGRPITFRSWEGCVCGSKGANKLKSVSLIRSTLSPNKTSQPPRFEPTSRWWRLYARLPHPRRARLYVCVRVGGTVRTHAPAQPYVHARARTHSRTVYKGESGGVYGQSKPRN